MPSRALRETLAWSEKVASMEIGAQDRFPRYFLAADDFGCFRVQPIVIAGRIYPLRRDMTPEKIESDLREFARVGVLMIWEAKDGHRYAFFTGWWEHNRKPRNGSRRKCPVPPHQNAQPPEKQPTDESASNDSDRMDDYPQRTAADGSGPQETAPAVRSSQFAVRGSQSQQDPPVSPPKEPGGQDLKVIPIRVGPDPVRLPKRQRRALTLAEKLELDRQEKRDQRSKALYAWLQKSRAPTWDTDAAAEVPGRDPPHDEQLAWVQEHCHSSPEEAADAVAIVEAAEAQSRSHGAV